MNTEPRTIISSAWSFLASLKLTLFLLIGIACLSVIGSTFIPQNAAPELYEQLYGGPVARLFQALSLTDMYHSWWFILLLALLVLNMVACTVRRFPHDRKVVAKPVVILDSALEQALPNVTIWQKAGNTADHAAAAAEVLGREFARPQMTVLKGEYHLFAQKGGYSRFSVYILHASILIILCGALIGFYFGFKGFVEIEEGASAATVYTRSGKPIDLGFDVRCDSFAVSYYDTGAPKEYRSVLSIVENGTTVLDRRPVIVNAPLTYRGITFYQNSYSEAAFLFAVRDRRTGVTSRITARPGERVALPNGDVLVVMESIGELRGQFEDYSGPAARVAVLPRHGTPEAFFLLKDFPQFNAERGGAYRLTYGGVSRWNTVLQATRDPGVRLVWVGCFLLVAGICMVYFLSHRRIWVRLSEGRIVLAGSVTRNQASFRVFFDDLAEKMKNI